jgi:chromosome segregation ATPase
MPKINRLRIVNFSYNNNNRHIIDECFDFYGGENALLSLANGGGKSVLVQAMLQPILPKVSLLGRKFGDFFIGKRTPSYILLEWKLDDEAGYLLTGIAVSSRVTHSANEEEENTDIRYFTFLCGYEKANDYDIKHIPVTEQVDSNVRIASYNEFKKLLQKEAGRNQSELFVYDSTREDQSQYERKLNNYSISREEWKELILNINEAEHGVSEVFSECKTSRKVMEQWIIKYIEKVLNKSSDSNLTDHKKLEAMMAQVAQALVDNENHIREYQSIEGFNRELELLYKDTKEVLTRLDQEDGLRKEIGGSYQVLKNEEAKLAQELVDVEERLKAIGEELEAIALEEKSQEIHQYTQELEVLKEKLLELEESGKSWKELLEEKKYKRDLQKAAERYGIIQQKEKTIAQLQQRLENASKDQENLMKDLNRVQYTLKIAYEEQLAGIKREMNATELLRESALEEIEKNKTGAAECQTQMDKLNKEIGGVDREISNFEKEEPGILESLNLQLFRNPLLKELAQQDIAKAGAQLSKEQQEAEMLLNEKRVEADKLKVAVSELRQYRDGLLAEHTGLEVEKASIAARVENYEGEKQKLLEALKRLDIQSQYLFDPDYLVKAVKEYLNDWENKTYHLKIEISELEKQIHGIEKGISYLPASLISILEEHNLPCYTGEKFLREIKEEDKKSLLLDNPLLPYALIATEKEIPQLEQLVSGMELSQVIPVIRYNRREQKIATGPENIEFLASSKNISIDNGDTAIVVKSLMEKKAETVLELEKAMEVVERVNQDQQIIIHFKWTEKQVHELEQESAGNEEAIRKNDEALQTCNQQIAASDKLQEELTARMESLKEELAVQQNRGKGFENYLAKNTKYMENVHLYNAIQGKINSLGAARKKFDEDKVRFEAEAEELRKLLVSKGNHKKDVEEKLTEVSAAKKDELMVDATVPELIGATIPELIHATIPELEGKLEAYKKQQNNEVSDLNDRIRGYRKDIQSDEKEIGKLKLTTEEYKTIEYSEETETELETLCGKLAGEIDGLKQDENDCRNRKSALTARIQEAGKVLNGNPVVPMERIKGHFSKRRQEANRGILENQTQRAGIHKSELELAKLISTIEAEIKEIRYMKAELPQKSFEEVKAAIDSMLHEYGNSRRKSNEAIDSFRSRSSKFINQYSGTGEGTVKEAAKGLQYQMEALDRSYEKYYYLSERMEYYFAQLSQILKIMESKMLQLEHSQNDLTEHAFMEASRIYHEIPKISENSTVEIDGVRRKVLEIQYEEMENELQAREKMSLYIQDCLQSLIKLIKGLEDENKLRRDIEKYMSTKELLNIISSLENCKIKAYKVDLNEKNRKMMPWEDIIIKNSGGEKFVAYFSLLVALISYSRKQIKGYEAFKRKEESKVLIMDNPFGPITSGHLLKPMFDIAEKYNTQLICLSDIKQGSVVNSFDLIYMIKIRQNMMQEDFLELEPILLKELRQDEKLENAHLYGRVEQASMFD